MTPKEWGELVGVWIAAILSFLGIPVTYFLTRRKQEAEVKKAEADAGVGISNARKLDAETLQVVSTVYQSIVSELRKELTETNTRLDKLEEESKEKDGRIQKLEKENRELKWHITQLEQQLNSKEDKVQDDNL